MRRQVAWTAVVASSLGLAIADPMVQMVWRQIAAGAVGIVWVTEVFRETQVLRPKVAALLAVAQGERVEAVRGRAVHAGPPAWERAAVVGEAADAGGSFSWSKTRI